MRFESQLSRMNCHTFSCGLSSGHLDGNATSVMLGGVTRRLDRCQPAWSSSSTACAPGAISVAIFGKMQVHRLRVAARQDQRRAFAFLGAERPEDVC